jgi:hypothetical protein
LAIQAILKMIEPAIPPGATVARPEEWIAARAKASQWLQNAHRTVQGAFPGIDWSRDSPEITKAQEQLDWYVWSHFYSDTATISDVREAWRKFYRLHLPGQQDLETSPTGER